MSSDRGRGRENAKTDSGYPDFPKEGRNADRFGEMGSFVGDGVYQYVCELLIFCMK